MQHIGPLLTHRGYVNTWECDDRGHLNVQFYPDRFGDAALHALAALGLDRAGRATMALAQEHLTFQRELRASDSISVHTGVLAVDATGVILLHELVESAGQHIAATSTQRIEIAGGTLPDAVRAKAEAVLVDLPQHARPRSVGQSAPPDFHLDGPGTEPLVEIRRCVVHPNELDADGRIRPRFLMGHFSDGAGHLWEAMGLPRGQMVDRGFGSVVVEMLMMPRRAIPAGTLLVVRSGVRSIAGKITNVTHFMFDAETREVVVVCEATALLMDLETRRAVALPDDIRAHTEKHLIAPAA